MVQKIGMGATDFSGDRLQRDGLRPVGEEQVPCRIDRGRAALFGGQSFALC